MKKTVKYFLITALTVTTIFFTACEENFTFPERPIPEGSIIIPVEEIVGIPTAVFPFIEVVLSGKVMPENATNKRIVWSIKADGGSGATLDRNRLYSETEADRTVTLTATIANGRGENIDYTQDFNILFSTSLAPVTSIIGIPQVIDVGEYVLNGTVRPNNAANKEIDWSVMDAGTTGAAIHGNILTTTAAGTAVITATVPYGRLDSDYTQDFEIVVFTEVASIGDIPSVVQVGNYTLEGVVAPSNATNQHITWSVIEAGATGATINGNVLNTTGLGTVTIRATIENGLLDGDYTQDFTITISATLVAVSGITGIPSTLESGSHALNGIVAPSNASNKNITWSVISQGTTGATISGNVLTTTAAGTVTVRAIIANGLLNGNNYTQDFNIIITAPVHHPIYAAGYYYTTPESQWTHTSDIACYWIDGELVELEVPNGTTFSYTTGIVIVNDIPYIAGYYNDIACYWVNGTRHDLSNGSGGGKTFSITAEGSTVYITGTDNYENCFWTITGNSAVKKVLTLPNGENLDSNTGTYTGNLAVNNGNVYIPFCTGNFYAHTHKSYYWDENGTAHAINSSYEICGIKVLNGTVYMTGTLMGVEEEDEYGGIYTMQPFYWAMGSSSHTVISSVDGRIYSIVEQNGSLWFYGFDENNQACYWNATGSKTVLGNEYDINNVIYSGGNVYIAHNAGGYRIPGTGGQFTQLYGAGGTANVQVTGLAVQ